MKSFYLAIWCNARIIWVYPSLIEEANNSGVTVDPTDTPESLRLKIDRQKAATDFNAAGSDLLNLLGNINYDN